MPNDLVHIGSFTISQGVLNIIGPLAGTVVGGLITYFVTRAIESQKWKQEKQERLSEIRRQGMGLALDWLDPIELSISRASSQVSSILHGVIEHEEVFETWPNLISQLAKMDIPVKVRVLLPDDIYSRGQAILRELEELRTKAVAGVQEMKIKKTHSPALSDCFDQLKKLDALLDELRARLIEEYKSTFL
jgi:hypothetical protein